MMRRKQPRGFIGLTLAIYLALFVLLLENASAQRSLDKERPFDGVPGILISCQPDPDVKWTTDGCTHLLAEVKRRAAESKLGVSVQPSSPDMAKKKFGQTDGFDGDKAIRMAWTFEESSSQKGQVSANLVSHRIWEAKEGEFHPLVGPRQSELYYMQGITFDPGISLTDAKGYLNRVLDTFFKYGEGKVKGERF
jgi:hypothetical protein